MDIFETEKCYFRYLKKTQMLLRSSLLALALCFAISSYAQPSNDNCSRPIAIPDVTNWCSTSGEFTNVGATPSGYGPASNWSGTNHDVWFKFQAFFTEVSITVVGNRSTSSGGTLRNPQIALYSGVCGAPISELRSAVAPSTIGAVTIIRNLIVGESYFIRIDGMNDNVGTFQLCLNSYNPPVTPGQDCATRSVLCNKDPFTIQKLVGPGNQRDEGSGTCLDAGVGTSEDQSTWYSWVAATSGTLTFTLKPVNGVDDIDWILYEFPNGIDNCTDRISLRCNATHPTGAGLFCGYETGLNLTSTDIEENINCNRGEDGFCKFIDMVAGKSYGLLINNFSTSGSGFSMEFGGTGEFLGPTADFVIDPPSGLKCEQSFKVEDFSQFVGGRIVKYKWEFGKDAIPATANTKGPHFINYTSYGEKFIVLTIETDIGCTVTEIRRLFAEPCCEDLPTLDLSIDSLKNGACFGSNNGILQVSGLLGSPKYMYSLDGEQFSENFRFDNLPAGNYTIFIEDRKGCRDSQMVRIDEPAQIKVDAGPDIEIELGDDTDLFAGVSPPNSYVFEWLGNDSIACRSCQGTRAIPPGTSLYKIKATDPNGCAGEDSVLVRVKLIRPFFAPNAFSPNNDNINDLFYFFGSQSNKAVKRIKKYQIFDRWGELVYKSENLMLNDQRAGWDGRFRGKELQPAVYVYLVDVEYIDNVVETFSGDFTLFR